MKFSPCGCCTPECLCCFDCTIPDCVKVTYDYVTCDIGSTCADDPGTFRYDRRTVSSLSWATRSAYIYRPAGGCNWIGLDYVANSIPTSRQFQSNITNCTGITNPMGVSCWIGRTFIPQVGIPDINFWNGIKPFHRINLGCVKRVTATPFIQFYMKDISGNPVAGATVTVTSTSPTGITYTGTTDATGYVTFTGVPAMSYRWSASKLFPGMPITNVLNELTTYGTVAEPYVKHTGCFNPAWDNDNVFTRCSPERFREVISPAPTCSTALTFSFDNGQGDPFNSMFTVTFEINRVTCSPLLLTSGDYTFFRRPLTNFSQQEVWFTPASNCFNKSNPTLSELMVKNISLGIC